MDDAKIGEGRKETEVFTQTKIEQMGELSVTVEMYYKNTFPTEFEI